MTQAITYILTLEEPCLLAAPGGDPNTESSLSYVPGGAVRGALVAAYLRERGQSDKQRFKDLFLNGKVRYLNAYPWAGRINKLPEKTLPPRRTLPARRAWATRKDVGEADEPDCQDLPAAAEDGQQADKNKFVYDRTIVRQRDCVDSGIPKGQGDAFVIVAGDAVWTVNIDYELGVHTARNRELGRAKENDADSALFRYQALARGQTFGGVILVDKDVKPEDFDCLKKLLRETVTLGGSHMAGYGLAQIDEVQEPAAWREVDAAPADIPEGESFIVYLTSHAILYDPRTGGPTSDVTLFLPGSAQDYQAEASFAAAGWVGGFNKQRGLPLAQEWAVKMGSTWLVRARRPVTAAEIAMLEAAGIGARTVEGFGRVVITSLPAWSGHPLTAEEEPLNAYAPVSQTAPADHDLLKRMNERLARQGLDQLLAAKVNELADRKNVRGHLSRSQLGRLQVRIRQEAGKDDFSAFIAYLDATTKRKSADDQFRKYSVDGQNFRGYLRKLTTKLKDDETVEEDKKPLTVWDVILKEGWQPPQVGPGANNDEYKTELAHEYTVRFIANLCRQLSKLEEES